MLNSNEDIYLMKNQSMALNQNYIVSGNIRQGTPGVINQGFNPGSRGKIIKGSVVAKNKQFSDSYKVSELIVKYFF